MKTGYPKILLWWRIAIERQWFSSAYLPGNRLAYSYFLAALNVNYKALHVYLLTYLDMQKAMS